MAIALGIFQFVLAFLFVVAGGAAVVDEEIPGPGRLGLLGVCALLAFVFLRTGLMLVGAWP